MNLINEIIHKAVTEESHKSRDSTWLVSNGNGSKQHTNVHSLAHSLKGRSGIVWMKKRCRRLRLLLTVILLSGSALSCGIMEAKEMHHVSLNFSTDVDINSQKLDFQIECTDLEQSFSVTVVCGCYWFQDEKDCFTLPGFICNSTTERLQVQIPQFSRQQAGKYQLRVLTGVHTTRTCILRIQELNATTLYPSLNDSSRNTTLTPNTPGRNGKSRVTEIILGCVGFILSIMVTAGVIVFCKKKALLQLIKKGNEFKENVKDTTTPKPGTEDIHKQQKNKEMVQLLSECISYSTGDINANSRHKNMLFSTEFELCTKRHDIQI